MTNFDREVITALARILANTEGECHRLGLTVDIVNGWRRYVRNKLPEDMAALVRQVCKDNKIPFATYEEAGQAREAAEIILSTVDGFYRKTLMRPN